MSTYDTDAIVQDTIPDPWQDVFTEMDIDPTELESWQVLDIILALRYGRREVENASDAGKVSAR